MSVGWRFRTEWKGTDVWVYSLSEPPGVDFSEIGGDAAGGEVVELPEEVKKAFGYPNGNGMSPKNVLTDADSGEIVKVFIDM